jgi:hypothetical protein
MLNHHHPINQNPIHMTKTIKSMLFLPLQRIKIALLKNKIKKMERSDYLNLWDRLELRNTMAILQNLEQQHMEEVNSPSLLSAH